MIYLFVPSVPFRGFLHVFKATSDTFHRILTLVLATPRIRYSIGDSLSTHRRAIF